MPDPAQNIRTVEPTRMSEITILLIVGAAILFVIGVWWSVSFVKWPDPGSADPVAHDRLDVLKLIAVAACVTLAGALGIQLSSWVGSKISFHAGADGVNANIESDNGGVQ